MRQRPVVGRSEIFNSSDRRYSCSRAPDGGGFASIVTVLNDGMVEVVATVVTGKANSHQEE